MTTSEPRRLRRLALFILVAALLAAGLPALALVSEQPDDTWDVNGRVRAILHLGGITYIGGDFTAVNDGGASSMSRNGLAAFDSSGNPTSWNPNVSGQVWALATDGTSIFAGGKFSRVGGVGMKKVAAIDKDGEPVAGWKANPNRIVHALAVIGTTLYIGGNFTSITDGSGTHTRSRLAAVSTADGDVLSWNPSPDDRVRALAPAADGSGRIFAAGNFLAVGGETRRRIAAINASTGALDAGFKPSVPTTYDLFAKGSAVYAAIGGAGGRCTKFDATNGDQIWEKEANGNLQAVVVIGSDVYCGGHFNGDGGFDGQPRNKIAAVSDATGALLDYDPVVNTALGIFVLATDGTRLYAGGDFTKWGGADQERFARLSP